MYETSDETVIGIYESFGKTQKSVDQDVAIIKGWMKTQPHLPEMMDDTKVRNFLLLNKFSIEKTKQKVDMYYTVRSLIPDIFENCNPRLPNMRTLFSTSYMVTHPRLVEGVHRVHFFKLKEPGALNPLDLTRMWFNVYEIRLCEDCMVNDIIICDFSTLTFSDIKKFSPSLIAKYFTIYKKVYSLRIRNLISINSPPFINILVNIVKSIMKPKVFERVKHYPDAEILHEFFDKDALPKDYGGDGPSLEELNDMMRSKLDQYQDRFDRLDLLRTEESLRPEKLNNDAILGFHGSFKKLEVD